MKYILITLFLSLAFINCSAQNSEPEITQKPQLVPDTGVLFRTFLTQNSLFTNETYCEDEFILHNCGDKYVIKFFLNSAKPVCNKVWATVVVTKNEEVLPLSSLTEIEAILKKAIEEKRIKSKIDKSKTGTFYQVYYKIKCE